MGQPGDVAAEELQKACMARYDFRTRLLGKREAGRVAADAKWGRAMTQSQERQALLDAGTSRQAVHWRQGDHT